MRYVNSDLEMKGEFFVFNKIIVKNKKVNKKKLEIFGFSKQKEGYFYTTFILGQQFQLMVSVLEDESMDTKIIDCQTGEEYVLHRTDEAVGSFVGKIREEYDNVLNQIVEVCYESDVFKCDDSRKVIAYVEQAYGDKLEFLWEKYPQNAIWRRKDTNKWYATLLVLSKEKLGIASDDKIDIINVRISYEELETLLSKPGYYPGYHMNKKHWCTICLDGSVPLEDIIQRIDKSYTLATK